MESEWVHRGILINKMIQNVKMDVDVDVVSVEAYCYRFDR